MKRLFILVLTLILLGCTAIAESAPAREFTVDEQAYDVYLDISTVYKEGVHYLEELGFLWDCALKMKSSSDAHDLWFSTTYLASDFARYAALSRYATDKCDYSDPKELYPLFSSLLSSKGDNATSIVWAGLELEHNAKYVKYAEDLQPTLNEAMAGIRSIIALNRDYPFLTDLKNYYKEASYLLDYIDNFEDNYSGFQNMLATQQKNQSSFEIDFEFIFNPADFAYVTEVRYAEQQTKYKAIYDRAVALENNQQYDKAINTYWQCIHYSDAAERIRTCRTSIELVEIENRYQTAVLKESTGDYHSAIDIYKELEEYKDCKERILVCEEAISQISGMIAPVQQEYYSKPIPLAAGYEMSIAITPDGKIHLTGDGYHCLEAFQNLNSTGNIQQILCHHDSDDLRILTGNGEVLGYWDYTDQWISTAYFTKGYTVKKLAQHGELSAALLDNNTVITAGHFKDRFTDVAQWKNIIDVAVLSASGAKAIAGLASDGTIKISTDGMNLDTASWNNIVMISAGEYHLVGVQNDGQVVATYHNDYRDNGQCNVSNWSDIVYVSVSDNHTVGLKYDGTVVATGYNKDGRCDVSEWTDIAYIAAGSNFTVGMKTDGSLVFAGDTSEMLENIYIFEPVAKSQTPQYEILKPGSKGQAVLDARMKLYELGYFSKKPTQTEYTNNMKDYVKKFEKDNGLKQDGVLSPEDQEVLFGL